MITYPARVHRDTYRGSNQRRMIKRDQHNRYAVTIENAVNRLLLAQTEPIRTYLWMEISEESGVPFDIVKDLGYSIECGSNGFTATRPGLSEDEYLEAMGRK